MTSTGIIRLAFQEPDHARPVHPHLVQDARPPVRRSRRHMHMHLPLEQTRLRLRQHRRFIAACSAGPAAWTLAMTILALAVRY